MPKKRRSVKRINKSASFQTQTKKQKTVHNTISKTRKKTWHICSVVTQYKNPNSGDKIIRVTFPNGIDKNILSKSLEYLSDNMCVDCPTNTAYKYYFDDNIKKCILIVHEKLFHRLRLTGFGYYFSIINNDNLWRRLKTVPIHPLLLRLYSTTPSNYTYDDYMQGDAFMNYEPVQMFNFVSIVGSWCNHIQQYVISDTFYDCILTPSEEGFHIYSYMHRLLYIFFDESTRFIDVIRENDLIEVMGKFLAIRSITYIKKTTFERVKSKYLNVFYEDASYSEFVMRHKWILNHFLANTSKLNSLSDDVVDDYINVKELCKLIHTDLPNAVGNTESQLFVSMCFLMCADPQLGDADLAKTLICSFETDLTITKHSRVRQNIIVAEKNGTIVTKNAELSQLQIICPNNLLPKSRPDRFGGQQYFMQTVRGKRDFEKLVKKVSQPPSYKNNFRLYYPGTKHREPLNPLLEFLSLIDHEVMRKTSSKAIDIKIIGDPDNLMDNTSTETSNDQQQQQLNADQTKSTAQNEGELPSVDIKDLHNIVKNVIQSVPSVIDCYDHVYGDDIDLPVGSLDNDKNSIVHFNDSFFVMK